VEVPVIVHRVDDQTAAAMALVENLQRQDLNPLEEAGAMQRLLDEFGLSQADLGRLLGKSRSAISRTLGLLALAAPVQALLQSGRLEAGHARVLLNLEEATQVRLARLAAEQGWSVRELETRKAALLAVPHPQPPKPVVRDPDVKRLEQQLGVWLAAPVSLRTHRHGGGAILIRFSSAEECSGILERIGFSTLLDD
jgi:ParB family chromosome partitioning protein